MPPADPCRRRFRGCAAWCRDGGATTHALAVAYLVNVTVLGYNFANADAALELRTWPLREQFLGRLTTPRQGLDFTLTNNRPVHLLSRQRTLPRADLAVAKLRGSRQSCSQDASASPLSATTAV